MNNIESLSNDLFNGEPYVGMPVFSLNRGYPMNRSSCDEVNRCPLAMAYVPWQCWGNTYEPAVALQRGTIFPDLDLPWEVR